MPDFSKNSLIMGRNTLSEVLSLAPERIVCLYVVKSGKSSPRAEELLTKARALRIAVSFISREEMDKMVRSDSHQGFAARVRPGKRTDWKELKERPSLIVVLDEPEDPHNLGAVLRSCECFRVSLVVWSKNRGAQISPVVTKVSSGASEIVPVQIVSNVSDFILKIKEEGYHILAARVSDKGENLFTYEFPEKAALILGSEGKGIRPGLQKKVDTSLYIPMYGRLDSLNLSQASAVILSFWRSQALFSRKKC